MAIDCCVARGILLYLNVFNPPVPQWYFFTIPYIEYPIEVGTNYASMFFIMALSLERHQAFFSPLDHRPKFWPYFITVTSTSLTVMVICMFHLQYDYDDDGKISGVVDTALFSDPRYSLPFISLVLAQAIFAFVLMFICNIRIYRHLRSMGDSANCKSAKTLFLIVGIFIFCHTIRIVFTGIAAFNPIKSGQTKYCLDLGRYVNLDLENLQKLYQGRVFSFDRPVVYHLMSSLITPFLVFHSSVDFLIFYCTGTCFRQECKNMFKTIYEKIRNRTS